MSTSERIAHAEDFFSRIPAIVKHGGDRAFYSVAGDYIRYRHSSSSSLLSRITQFVDMNPYIGPVPQAGAIERSRTDLGIPNMLSRNSSRNWEQLFLCASLSIHLEPRTDHAPYIANWLNALRNEKRFLISAAGKAQQAADYLHQIAAAAEQRAS